MRKSQINFLRYCAYNVFHITFRRNPRVLIEKKTLGLSLRKNRAPTNPRVPREAKFEDQRAHLQQPCCSSNKVSQPARALWHDHATNLWEARATPFRLRK